MKKVVLALAVVFSVALVSCSSKENKGADSVAADTTEVVAPADSCCTDSCQKDSSCCDSAKAEAPAETPAE